MIAYQSDHDGWYAGTVEADESPLEPGVFLLPGGAVWAAPPPERYWIDGLRPRLSGKGWVLQLFPQMSPSEKLAQFLADHPDVAAMIKSS